MNTQKALLKTIICDDHPLVLEGLSAILLPIKGFEIQTIVQNGADLLQAIQLHHPDVILIDAHLKNEIGFDLIPKIKEQTPTNYNPNIFIITSYMDDYMVSKALHSGATGCISKSITGEEFIQAIKFPKLNSSLTIPSNIQTEIKRSGLALLTQREKDIIQLITQGHSSKKIAECLNISTFTVETHKKNIYRKLKFNSATELLAWYFANKDFLPLNANDNFDSYN